MSKRLGDGGRAIPLPERPMWTRSLLGYPPVDDWARDLRLRDEPELPLDLPRVYPPSA